MPSIARRAFRKGNAGAAAEEVTVLGRKVF
jgi:hypothetical protein